MERFLEGRWVSFWAMEILVPMGRALEHESVRTDLAIRAKVEVKEL